MKINKLKINGYGKLKDKEINLGNNLNIIYGKNESGKSTLLKFIVNSFYGTSKNKKGKEISDYDKYLPWDTEEFSGKIDYKLDNGQSFEIYREFKKKNPKIFNEISEDITKEFNINKSTGSEFFYEQTKIDEETFLSTAIIEQQEVKLEKNIQNILIQKISNLINTGKDNNSYKKIIEKINKKQLDEIGTDRTREKPINVVKARIELINDELREAQKYGNQGKELSQKIEELEQNNLHNNKQIEILQNITILKQEERLEEEKIKVSEKIQKNNLEKIESLKKEKNKLEKTKNNENIFEKNKKEKNKTKNNKKIILFFIILLIINVLQYIFIENKVFKNIFLLTVPTYLIFCYFLKNKLNKKEKNIQKINIEENNLINNKINEIENEIKIIEKNNNEIKNEIEKIKKEKNNKIEIEKEKIKNKYKITEEEIDQNLLVQNINDKINFLQQQRNKNEIEIANLKIKKEAQEDEKIKAEKLTEEKIMLIEKYEELCRKNESINLAKTVIEQAYETMKRSVSPKFTENLSSTISTITNR